MCGADEKSHVLMIALIDSLWRLTEGSKLQKKTKQLMKFSFVYMQFLEFYFFSRLKKIEISIKRVKDFRSVISIK